jgi:hypothetical protein
VLRPETKTSIPEDQATPKRKSAGKSELSPNFSTTSDNEYSVIGADCAKLKLSRRCAPRRVWRDPKPRRGFYKLRCGLPEANAPAGDAIYNFEQLPSRVGRVPALMWIYIAARIFQGWAEIDLEDATDYLYLEDSRGTRQAITDLESKGLISRKPGAPWHFCIHPERIEALPPLDRRAPKDYPERKNKSMQSSHHATRDNAAYANRSGTFETEGRSVGIGADIGEGQADEAATLDATTDGADATGNAQPRSMAGGLDTDFAIRTDEPMGDRVERFDAGRLSQQCLEVVSSLENGGCNRAGSEGASDTVSETGFTVGLALGVAAAHGMIGRIETGFNFAEAGFRPRETYCTWNWTCPHLVNDLQAPKILNSVDIEQSTTTGAAAPLPAESENAYLARYLEPSTRIGEMLEIDDAAAGRMWRESLAVCPTLTPREFVLIVRMKLREWQRVDDDRPGRRVRSLTGLLVRSMPNAVQGALYLSARDQAPAELVEDCRRARAILAGDNAPRDRAWARAMLAEAGKT